MQLFTLALLVPYVLALSTPVIKIRDSPITLPLALKINATGHQNVLEADRVRARVFIESRHENSKRAASVATLAAPSDALSHTLTVGVGTPPTSFTFLLDTGSGNTWVGATSKKLNSTTLVNDGRIITDGYTNVRTLSTGVVIQNFVRDNFTIVPGKTISQQGFGTLISANNFQLPEGVDGIMGLGPVDQTRGSIVSGPFSTVTIPTVTDNLFSQGLVPDNQIALSFELPGHYNSTVQGGEVSFGGVNPSKFKGDISFVAVNSTGLPRNCWCFPQSIRYGASTPIMSNIVGQLDTKSVFILLPTESFAAYQNATGATLDSATGLLRVTPAQLKSMRSLFFNIGGASYELAPKAQAWPQNLNSLIGGDPNSIYLIVASLPPVSASFPNADTTFVNGYSWIAHFYTVLDTANKRIGFAPNA